MADEAVGPHGLHCVGEPEDHGDHGDHVQCPAVSSSDFY